MKKLIAMLLCLCILWAAVPSFAEGKTKIVFWHSMSDDAGVALSELIDTFNQTVGAEKGIEVEAVFQGKYTDAISKMNNIISAGTFADLPDVLNLDATGKINYYASGCAYTVDQAVLDDPEWDITRYTDSALGNWQFAGTQLGIPFATSTTLMFYNKDLIPEAPETLADIAALAGKTGDATVYAAVPNTPTLANWLGQIGSYVVNFANGAEDNATELACVENGALLTFLTEWKALYASGALVNESGSTDDFVVGKLGIITTSSSNINSLLEKIGGRFELGVANYPKVNADAFFGATVSGSCLVMFDSRDDARKAASRELIKYLCGAEAQAVFSARTGYIPSNKDSIATDTYQALLNDYPQYQVGIDQLEQTPAAMRSVTVGPSVDFYYAIQNNIIDMLDEDIDPTEAVEMMADELQELLDQYNRNNR